MRQRVNADLDELRAEGELDPIGKAHAACRQGLAAIHIPHAFQRKAMRAGFGKLFDDTHAGCLHCGPDTGRGRIADAEPPANGIAGGNDRRGDTGGCGRSAADDGRGKIRIAE